MAYENIKNKGFDNRTTNEQQEIARQGGIASGEARRKKKTMQEIAKYILNMSIQQGKKYSIEEIQNLAEVKGKNISVDEAILLKQVEKALKGDLSSATFIRDTAGQKPIEKIEHSGELDNPYSKLTEEQLKKLAGE